MTQILIIEDEIPAATKLVKQILSLQPDWNILAVKDSITASVTFLQTQQPDIIFMDIHLADGDSFEIFNQVTIQCPVIFTTAHSEYAIKAFKVNGLDYLLKPIPIEELERAINKYSTQLAEKHALPKNIQAILKKMQANYKERFLLKFNNQLISIQTSAIAYFYSEDKLSFIKTKKGDRFPIDESLDKLVKNLNPSQFFRINRQTILHIDSINKIESYFNGRLSLTVHPSHQENFIVSREKVRYFKDWLDR